MSLASTQAAIDAFVALKFPELAATQAGYKVANGVFWQGVFNQRARPNNGAMRNPNGLADAPLGRPEYEAWNELAGLASFYGAALARFRVDVMGDGGKDDWLLHAEHAYDGVAYFKRWDSSGSVIRDWEEVGNT